MFNLHLLRLLILSGIIKIGRKIHGKNSHIFENNVFRFLLLYGVQKTCFERFQLQVTLSIPGFKHECTKIPKSLASRTCCNYPQIFPYGIVKICVKRAPAKANLCYYDCVFNAMNICHKSKCNYLKAYDYINWIFPANHPFIDIYRKAFRKCVSKANELHSNRLARFKSRGCNPLPEIVYLCVENEMLTKCPMDYWNTWNPQCQHKRDFINNCLGKDIE